MSPAARFRAERHSRFCSVTPAELKNTAEERFRSFSWLNCGSLRRERHDCLIVRQEVLARDLLDVLRCDSLVQGENLVDRLGCTAKPDIWSKNVGDCRGAVHTQCQTVSNARACRVELCLIDGLFSEAFERHKDLVSNVVDILRIFDAGIDREQFGVRMIS